MKIVIVASLDTSLITFRGELIRALTKDGHEVVAVAPGSQARLIDRLQQMGVHYRPIAMDRAGLNPLKDLRTILALRQILLEESPDIVFTYTPKPVIYGSLVAASRRVPQIYSLVTGLGVSLNAHGFKGHMLQILVLYLYKLAFARCTKVFVQNEEIGALFRTRKVTTPEKITVVAGSGVDTEHFKFSSIPNGPPVFLYLGRLLRQKGLNELIAAARVVKQRVEGARFVVAGALDENPETYSERDLLAWKEEGVIEHVGYHDDVRPWLTNCYAFILPSYHEGMPRSSLEAMSVGRPVVTTDAIGCRETVPDATPFPQAGAGVRRGPSGLLVPVRSAESLASAIEWLAKNRQDAAAMGVEGRKLAESVFNVHSVNNVLMKEMRLIPATCVA